MIDSERALVINRAGWDRVAPMFQRVRLIESPMEVNPGIPLGSFDLVFSIYGLGWTTDLPGTLALVVEGGAHRHSAPHARHVRH